MPQSIEKFQLSCYRSIALLFKIHLLINQLLTKICETYSSTKLCAVVLIQQNKHAQHTYLQSMV